MTDPLDKRLEAQGKRAPIAGEELVERLDQHRCENSDCWLDVTNRECAKEFVRHEVAEAVEFETARCTDLCDRITDYLCKGGLFNPEMMEHDKGAKSVDGLS